MLSYYDILAVDKQADEKQVRQAFRKQARQYHPDLNPGDKAAEEKFKEVAGAYDLLSDADKRKRFDAGEIDASGAERPQHHYYRDKCHVQCISTAKIMLCLILRQEVVRLNVHSVILLTKQKIQYQELLADSVSNLMKELKKNCIF